MESKNSFYGRSSIFGVLCLFVYFSALTIVGLTITLYIIYSNNMGKSYFYFLYNGAKLNQYNLALTGSIGSTLLGCSIFYIKKLYKLSLSGNFLLDIENDKDKLENIGTTIYFIFRPVFAVSFTILMILGIKGGVITVAGKSFEVNSSFTDLTMFLSYFIGFSAGKFLSTLEKKSNKIIENILKDNNEKN